MKSIQNVIKQLIDAHHLEESFLFTRVVSAWEDNFPPAFRANITLLKLENKTLYVRIQSPVWRQEARLVADKIVVSLNDFLGNNEIEKIVINNG